MNFLAQHSKKFLIGSGGGLGILVWLITSLTTENRRLQQKYEAAIEHERDFLLTLVAAEKQGNLKGAVITAITKWNTAQAQGEVPLVEAPAATPLPTPEPVATESVNEPSSMPYPIQAQTKK